MTQADTFLPHEQLIVPNPSWIGAGRHPCSCSGCIHGGEFVCVHVWQVEYIPVCVFSPGNA